MHNHPILTGLAVAVSVGLVLAVVAFVWAIRNPNTEYNAALHRKDPLRSSEDPRHPMNRKP